MTKEQALHNFWSSFGWKAYDETSVPDEAQLPRITYEVSTDSFGHEVAQTASLWMRKTGWKEISDKADEIERAITKGGKMLAYTGGALWIKRGSPWAQRMADDDDTLRRIVLNVSVEFVD
jgi:hypothetical protein